MSCHFMTKKIEGSEWAKHVLAQQLQAQAFSVGALIALCVALVQVIVCS